MKYLMRIRTLAVVIAGFGTVSLPPGPALAAESPTVKSCSSGLIARIASSLTENRLFGEQVKPKYICLKYPGDKFNTVIAYIGNVSSDKVAALVPLAAMTPAIDFDLKDLTFVFSPSLSNSAKRRILDPKDIEKALTGGKPLSWEPIKYLNGVNLVARVDLSASTLKTLFKAVGIKAGDLKRWTAHGNISLDMSPVIKSEKKKKKFNLAPKRSASVTFQRRKPIKDIFGATGASLRKIKLKLKVSQELKSGSKPEKSVSAKGTLTYKKKSYALYAHSGGALALDTEELTLRDFFNAVELSGKAIGQPWSGLAKKVKLPKKVLNAVKFTRKRPVCKDAALEFSRYMIAASRSGNAVPIEVAPECQTKGFSKNQHLNLVRKFAAFGSPAVTVNGALDLLGRKVAQANVSFTGKEGLNMDISLGTFDLAGLSLKEARFRAKAENPAKGLGAHQASFVGKASILDVFEGELTVGIKNGGYEFSIPANCPLLPTGVTGSTGSLDNPKDFDISFKLKDCYSKAIIAAIKDPKKLVKFGQSLANESISFADNTVEDLGGAIVNADKAWKASWKASVSAGQTAAKAVKSIDKTISSLGNQIGKIGGEIKDLGKSIKKLAKKIGDFFKGKIKKKKKKKKAKERKKRSLEARREKARKDRKRAKKALGKLAPHLDPKILKARDQRAGLLFEKKLADARKAYAEKLKKGLKNASKRKALVKKYNIDVGAVISDQLGDSIKGGSLKSLTSAGTEIKKGLTYNRLVIERKVMTAIFEKAMQAHLETIKPDVEKSVPYNTPIRIVGQYNLCLETFLRIVDGQFRSWKNTNEIFQQRMLRLNRCNAKDEIETVTETKEVFKSSKTTAYTTQRFKFTAAGKLVALFKQRDACFQGTGAALRTAYCLDKVEQLFFFDPTIDALRPLAAKGKSASRCIGTRGAARIGAGAELKPCGKNKKSQKFSFEKWTSSLPKKVKVPLLPSLWRNYKKGFAKAAVQKHGDIVTLSGLIRLRPRDSKTPRDWSEPIDVLPPQYRPDRRLIFNVNTHYRPSRIDVNPDGRVLRIAGDTAHDWISLSGITYPTKGAKPFKLADLCKKYKSAAYAPPSYIRSGDTVTLSGLIACPFNGPRALAKLPAGFRPAKRLVFNVNAHEASARVDVFPGGIVQWRAGGGKKHGWISLNGITFIRAGTARRKAPAAKGCKAYGGKYAPPTVSKANGVVRVSGLLNCSFSKKERNLVTLPKGFRPSKTLIFDVAVQGSLQSVRVNVLPDGRVRSIVSPQFYLKSLIKRKIPLKWISLNGIAFPEKANAMALKW